MSAKLDIGDEATVKTFAALLIDLLSRDPDDPSYMPDTRDLSSCHRGMRLTYLKSIVPPAKTEVKGSGGASNDR